MILQTFPAHGRDDCALNGPSDGTVSFMPAATENRRRAIMAPMLVELVE
jgi:hypothetical protein